MVKTSVKIALGVWLALVGSGFTWLLVFAINNTVLFNALGAIVCGLFVLGIATLCLAVVFTLALCDIGNE